MGKHLIKSEESNQIHEVNQGCMWGMFNILDYHQWGVKRVFHHKKKRHDRYKRKTTLQEQQNVVTEAESQLVSQRREILNAKGQTSSENALHQKKEGNATESSLKRDISIKFKNNDDVLEIISVEKNLLLKFLKDIDFGGKRNHKASHNKARLTKSGSFPLPASSKTKNITSSTFRAKQTEIWDFPKGEKLRAGTQVPKKFGSSSVKDISYETPKPSVTDNGIDSAIAVGQKSSISSRSSDGLNHKGWNQVVIHQFKVIKQKIKHAIVELKKSGHNKASPEYSIIDNEKEISQSLADGAIHEYRKSKSLSETKASESGSNKHEPQLMRRTSSLNESMDRYTQLFEKSLSKEVKWQSSKSKSLRLTNDDKTQKSGHARMFSRSNLSMPNLEALGFILHEALLETNDMGNNTMESDNDVQSKSASLPLKNDESTDHFKEAEIDETVEESGRDVNPSPRSLSDKTVEKIDEGVTFDQREDINEPAAEQEGKESNTRGTNASVTVAEDTNKSLENDILHFKSYSETDSNFKYVKDILEYSGFTRNEQTQMRYTVDQPIKPSLFTALEESLLHENDENEYSGEENTNNCDRQLLFNLINEVLFQMYEKSPTYFPKPFAFNYKLKSMPKGNYLVNEVWNNVSSYLTLRPELDETLDDVVGRDLAKGTGWMNLQQEEECVALELEEMIIDDLLDEIIFS